MSMRRGVFRSIVPVVLALVSACAEPRAPRVSSSLPMGHVVPPSRVETGAQTPAPASPSQGASLPWRLEGAQVAPPSADASTRPGARRLVSLAFERAPILTVANAVLGEILGRSFRVDPDVTGSVSLRLSGSLTEQQLLAQFDQALRGAGAALVEEPSGGFAVVALARAPALSRPPSVSPRAQSFSNGVVVYPAQHVSAADLGRLLQPMAGNVAQVRVDPAREQVFLSGDPTTVNALLATARLFDVDWFRGLSFQYFPLQHADPKTLSAELRRIFGGPEGPVGTRLDLIEIQRLNAIIAVAKKPTLLDQVGQWVTRLDAAAPETGRRFRSIPLSNLVAEDFVKVLSDLLGGPRPAPPGATTDAPAPPSSPTLRVSADSRSNAIILMADDSEYQNVLSIVRTLDIVPAQVLIEATIAEVTLNDQLRYGVQFFLETSSGGGFGFSTGTDSSAPSAFPGFTFRSVGTDFRVALNALDSVTDVQLISTPRILVLANETATLKVGDQVPIITQSAIGLEDNSRIVNTVEYRDTGVVLSVTPRVGDQGRMFIEIEQEVSEVTGTTSSEIDSPTIQQRRFQTIVQVEDGQAIALGGLIRSNQNISESGIPGLRKAPLVGGLFRSRNRSARQTELVVFLRPRIVRSRSQADEVTAEIAERLQRLGLTRDGL